jgi:type IV pilus assembly protein PilB
MFKLDTSKTIADVLYEKGHLNVDQLSAIKFENVNTGKSIEEIIKSRGYVSEEDYVMAYGELYGIEFVTLNPSQIDSKFLDLLPLNVAKRHNIAPFALQDKNLSLAMADPMDLPTIDFVERKTGFKVIPYIATQKNIDNVLDSQKGSELTEEITEAMKTLDQNTLKIEESNQDLNDATIRDAPIARIVSMILETAVKNGASDVHLEPGEYKTRLRYRVDGILEEKRTLPKEMHDSVVARIKILSNMKIDEKRVPLDGQFKVQVGETETDLRVSTLPTIFGEKVVIRLLQEEGTIYTFRDLGMRGYTLRRYEEIILKPNGMLLATGPTSSGKTVTLASTLSKLNTARVNIITLEDPVEIRITGINQVQVNPQAGLTFAMGLRSFLRQDPNIIFVGEIRDGETAELAVHAALTGHLVLSTLHTNSAAGAIPRLLDMGVEAFLLSSTLAGVLAQRLVRRICEFCKEEYEPPEEIQTDLKETIAAISANTVLVSKDTEVAKLLNKVKGQEKLKLYHGKGCAKCDNVGYKGRVGLFELLSASEAIAHATLDGSPSSKLHEISVKEGMITLLEDGIVRALEGTTTLEEVMRVAKE